MKNFNYRYIVTPNKVIALSSYAGRPVRGIAKCHPNDTFDVEYGKKLAAARCNYKIAVKRHKAAQDKYYKLAAQLRELNTEFLRACDFLTDTAHKVDGAKKEVAEVRAEIQDK